MILANAVAGFVLFDNQRNALDVSPAGSTLSSSTGTTDMPNANSASA